MVIVPRSYSLTATSVTNPLSSLNTTASVTKPLSWSVTQILSAVLTVVKVSVSVSGLAVTVIPEPPTMVNVLTPSALASIVLPPVTRT